MGTTERARRYVRRIKVRFRAKDDDREYTGYTLDVSTTGMFVAAARRLPPGTRIQLEVADRGASFVIEAEVVREKKVPPELQRVEPGGIGVRFMPVEELIGELLPARAPAPTTERSASSAGTPALRVELRRKGELLILQRDVKQGALFIRTAEPPAEGTAVQVTIVAPGGAQIQFAGTVAQTVGSAGQGDENLVAGVSVRPEDVAAVEKQIEAALSS